MSYWPFNEGTGTTSADVAGENDVTFVGNPTWVPSDLMTSDLMTSIQPDLQIRTDNELTYTGDDIYNNLPAQSKSQITGPGMTMIYDVLLQNERIAIDRFALQATAGDANWIVKILDLSTQTDITNAITTTGWISSTLSAKGQLELQIQIRAADGFSTQGASKAIILSAASISDPNKVDTVKATATFHQDPHAGL